VCELRRAISPLPCFHTRRSQGGDDDEEEVEYDEEEEEEFDDEEYDEEDEEEEGGDDDDAGGEVKSKTRSQLAQLYDEGVRYTRSTWLPKDRTCQLTRWAPSLSLALGD
jgi:hypothetical protein